MSALRTIAVFFAFVVTVARGAERIAVAPDVYNGAVVATPDVKTAQRYFDRAKQAADEGRVSEAITLATRAVAIDPNHAAARRVLGYERDGDRWLTPWQAERVERGEQWDPRFGWVRQADVPRLERGERRVGGDWLSADAAAKRTERIEDGFQVRTDSFVVTTNHSLEAAAALAAELEGLRQAWRQVFAAYVLPERQVRQLFAGQRDAPQPGRAMQVYYHRSKEGYVEHLRRRQPRIADTNGIYFDVIRQAHFFHDAGRGGEGGQRGANGRGGPNRATLYHEGVHQLFQESRRTATGAGKNANFWAIEGVACLFEGLTPQTAEGLAPRTAGGGTIGYTLNLQSGRTASARRRSAEGRPLVPLSELVAVGWSDFQRQPDLPAWYAQSTALAALLLEAEPQGRPDRRDAFVEYLATVYGERPDGGQLERTLGVTLGDLEREFRLFLADPPRGAAASRGANLSH
jgi:hypothetical protein